MKRVNINLEPDVAAYLTNASAAERKKTEALINRWLKYLLGSGKRQKERLFETMETAGKIAALNHLTPEKLKDILDEVE